jgi:hypothetical protein
MVGDVNVNDLSELGGVKGLVWLARKAPEARGFLAFRSFSLSISFNTMRN